MYQMVFFQLNVLFVTLKLVFCSEMLHLLHTHMIGKLESVLFFNA